MTGYRYTEHNDGSLTVHDVELFGLMHHTTHPALAAHGIDIDEAWMHQAITLAKLVEAKGKAAGYLMRGHNQPDQPAEMVGTLANLRYQAPWIVADIHATEPTVIAKLKRGEMRKRSAEFKADTHHIWGLSLIDGQEGHFDEELPDLVLSASTERASEELREAVLLASDRGRVSLSLHNANPIHLENRMGPDTPHGGPDQQKTIESLSAEVEALAKQVKNLTAQIQAQNPSGTPDENTVALVEEGMREDEERVAQLTDEPAPATDDEERKRRAMEVAGNPAKLSRWQAHRNLVGHKAAKLASEGIDPNLAYVRLNACATTGEMEREEQILKLQQKPSGTRAPAEQGGISGDPIKLWNERIEGHMSAGRSRVEAIKLTREDAQLFEAVTAVRSAAVRA